MPIISIQIAPVHSNIAQYITYEISKRQLLQHWDDQKLTHTADWDYIDLTSFKQARLMISFHMAHFITKCISNTLSTMTFIQRQGHATTNLFPRYDITLVIIQHLYQCTHKGIRDRWTNSVDTLRKWLEAQNTDPYIAVLLDKSLLYIVGERNDLTQWPSLTVHSDIL